MTPSPGGGVLFPLKQQICANILPTKWGIPIPDTKPLEGIIMIKALVMLLIAILSLSSCVTPQSQQMSNLKQIQADIAASNMEIDQINAEQNQLKVAIQDTARKEMTLLNSMKQDELVIYDNLKTALLHRDTVKTTYYYKQYVNFVKTNYTPTMASNRLNETRNVLQEIEHNYITLHNLSLKLKKQDIKHDTIQKELLINAPR